jgi:hypothetical protein
MMEDRGDEVAVVGTDSDMVASLVENYGLI